VILQIVDRMRSFSISHAPIIMMPRLKTACLKAGVLDPIYRQ
jgi:hypothetical protein